MTWWKNLKEEPGKVPGWLGFRKCFWEHIVWWIVLVAVFCGIIGLFLLNE